MDPRYFQSSLPSVQARKPVSSSPYPSNPAVPGIRPSNPANFSNQPSFHPQDQLNTHNMQCDVCASGEAATRVCYCRTPQVRLCDVCFPKHVIVGYGHEVLPITAYPFVRQPGDHLKFLERLKKLDHLKRNLVQEFKERVREARNDVEQRYSDYIQSLQLQQQQLVTELDRICQSGNQVIIDCLQEAEMHIYEDEFLHDKALARNIATYCKTSIQPNLQLFMYERNASMQFPTDIERLIRATDNYSENSSHLLVSLRDSTLVVHNCASGTSLRELTVNWPSQSRYYTMTSQVLKYYCNPQWVLLGTSHLLRFDASFTNPALLNFENAQVKPLPECTNSLSHRGLVRFGNYVYAFGGLNLETVQTVQTVDRLNLSSEQWDLPFDMRTRRSHFTPCVHDNFIYLAGGCANDIPHEGTFQGYSEEVKIEIYDPWRIGFTTQM